MRGIVFISTPHPKANDLPTCDRLNLIARTFETPLQKCIIMHEELKQILTICAESECIPQLACPIFVAYETAQTLIQYKGWFNIKSKTTKYVSQPRCEFLLDFKTPSGSKLADLHPVFKALSANGLDSWWMKDSAASITPTLDRFRSQEST